MIVPGSLERLNHKNDNTPTSSSSSWYLRNIWTYLERLAATMGLPLSLPALSSWLSIDLALELIAKVGAKIHLAAIASANMAGKS
jgi:hypothetical protein